MRPPRLLSWYPGQKGGEAIAEILSGAVYSSDGCRSHFPGAKRSCRTRLSRATRPEYRSARSDGAVIMIEPSSPATTRARRWATSGISTQRTAAFSLRLRAFVHDLRPWSKRACRRRKRHRPRDRLGFWRKGRRRHSGVLCLRAGGVNITLRLAGWSRVDLAPGEEREGRALQLIRACLRRSTRVRAGGEFAATTGSPPASMWSAVNRQ